MSTSEQSGVDALLGDAAALAISFLTVLNARVNSISSSGAAVCPAARKPGMHASPPRCAMVVRAGKLDSALTNSGRAKRALPCLLTSAFRSSPFPRGQSTAASRPQLPMKPVNYSQPIRITGAPAEVLASDPAVSAADVDEFIEGSTAPDNLASQGSEAARVPRLDAIRTAITQPRIVCHGSARMQSRADCRESCPPGGSSRSTFSLRRLAWPATILA